MDIKYEFRDLAKVKALADRAPDVFLRNMITAAKVATRAVQGTARAKHKFRSQSGLTELAIETDVRTNGQEGVVGEVSLNDAVSPYGRFLHDGAKPHVIAPRKKKALRWPAGGGFRFAMKVMHPGTKPDPFIYSAGEANQANINEIFNRYVDRAAKEVNR